MNENLQNALTELIISTTDAKDFLLSEAPEVIHQLLTWKLVANSLSSFLFTGITVLCFYLMFKCSRSDDDDALFGFFLSGLFGILFGTISIGCVHDALQIWIAPKVYLLEYAASLAK